MRYTERILLLTILNTHIQSEVLEDSINLMKKGMSFHDKLHLKTLSLEDNVIKSIDDAYEMLWYYWFLFDKKKHGSVQTTVHSVKVSDIALTNKTDVTQKVTKFTRLLSQFGKDFDEEFISESTIKVLDYFIKNQDQNQPEIQSQN